MHGVKMCFTLTTLSMSALLGVVCPPRRSTLYPVQDGFYVTCVATGPRNHPVTSLDRIGRLIK